MGVWLLLFAYPELFNALQWPRTLHLLFAPFMLGAIFGATIFGHHGPRVHWVLLTPVIPVFITDAIFEVDTDPEGRAFAWIYAAAPLPAFYLGAVSAIGLRRFFSK